MPPGSEVGDAPRSETGDQSHSESGLVLSSILDRVSQDILPASEAGPQETAGEVTPPAHVESSVDKPSRAGGKRQRSRSRSQSLSPANKDRRRDPSQDPALERDPSLDPALERDPSLDSSNTQAALDLPEMSGAVAKTTLPPLLPELVPLPIDDDTDLSDTSIGVHSGDITALEELLDICTAKTNLDTPLTQVTPNLPCATQERVHYSSVPENSQLSDESKLIHRFFAKSSSSSEEDVA